MLRYGQLLLSTARRCLQDGTIVSQPRQITTSPVSLLLSGHTRNTLGALTVLSQRSSTFTQMTIEQLWDGCSGVSNAGKKRGRGKRGSTKRRLNLFAGKGLGYSNFKRHNYPGLNTQVIKGNELLSMTVEEKDPKFEEQIIQLRDKINKKTRMKKFPLQRGWSGGRISGQSIGPPDPFNEATFEDFDSRVLEFKLVSHMTGNMGRKHSYSALVVVGNKKGLVGIAVAKASLGSAAVRKAKNMAVQRLQYVDLKDNQTIYHNFHVQVGATHVFAAPKPPGYGIVCHRVLKTVAECIGIQDLYCKVEGRSKNVQNVVDAFLKGLSNQESHQDLANRTNYYVVELSDAYKVPTVLAKPRDSIINEQPLENFDLTRHYHGGKALLRKGKRTKFYEKRGGYHKYKFMKYKRRNQYMLAVKRQAAALE